MAVWGSVRPASTFWRSISTWQTSKEETHRSECRHQRWQYATISDTSHQLDGGASRLQTSQKSDSASDIITKSVHNGEKQYLMEDRLLYRVAEWDGVRKCTKELVLPRMSREMALRTAHSVPMAGHLGWKKTMNRLLERLLWPGIYMDVQELCWTCSECQRVARHHKHMAPLMSLPVVDQPFKRVGIDLVWPLPRTRASHCYVVTMVDYRTRYPEAIPLCQTDSQTIAAELMTILSRVGVPKEILSDCGANLTSKLIKEPYNFCMSSRSEPPPAILTPMIWWRVSTQQWR